IVAAVTGGPESEALVRRASRIASKAGGDLLVLHVLGDDGTSRAPAPRVGKIRQLSISLGASLHTVIGDDVPTALLDFARDV
ncbi:universal stress protein, partial [Mycolicibacter arupensis]